MIYLRTPEEKADPEAWWKKPDEIFFAAGACHILASVYVQQFAGIGYKPMFIKPTADFRGGHVVAASRTRILDASGFHARNNFLEDYFAEMRSLQPDWDADLVELELDPAAWDFCKAHFYRHPTQFPHDPIPRAERFIEKLHEQTQQR